MSGLKPRDHTLDETMPINITLSLDITFIKITYVNDRVSSAMIYEVEIYLFEIFSMKIGL